MGPRVAVPARRYIGGKKAAELLKIPQQEFRDWAKRHELKPERIIFWDMLLQYRPDLRRRCRLPHLMTVRDVAKILGKSDGYVLGRIEKHILRCAWLYSLGRVDRIQSLAGIRHTDRTSEPRRLRAEPRTTYINHIDPPPADPLGYENDQYKREHEAAERRSGRDR